MILAPPNDINELDQVIGVPVPTWQSASMPGNTILMGVYCSLQRLDVSRQSAELFQAFTEDTQGTDWTYLPYGPFSKYDKFQAWLAERSKQVILYAISGSIINISSITSTMTMNKSIAYAASKAAMNKWTENAAINLAEHGIRINAIAPGLIEAGMNENTRTTNPELWEYYISNIPLKRSGTPADIAAMAVFLASDKATWITGQVYEVDGGHAL